MNELLKILLHSVEIKKTIYKRSLEFKIPLRYLCLEAGVDYQNFMKSYINSNSGKARITEEQFRTILGILGIDIRYQFVINENADVKKTSADLAAKYQNI